MNFCHFIGNVGKDPEVRNTQNGDTVVTFSLAVTERWKDANGQKKESTQWVPVVIWNQGLAKVAQAYVKKGSKVAITGKWQTRKWTDQSGHEKYTTECVLQKFGGELMLLDGAPKDERQQREQAAYGGNDLNDEIPF